MYALSGVGIVVLYRATGVLNLAFGAIGAMGALIAWTLINHTAFPDWASYLVCVVFGGFAPWPTAWSSGRRSPAATRW